jgi:hypothetical protein
MWSIVLQILSSKFEVGCGSGAQLIKVLVFVTAAIQFLVWRDKKKESAVEIEGTPPSSLIQVHAEEKKSAYSEANETASLG